MKVIWLLVLFQSFTMAAVNGLPWASCDEAPVIPEDLTDSTFDRTPVEWTDGIYDTLEVIDTLLKKKNIKYTMIGGTLLGAVRHKGIIPWDDDGDVAVLEEDMGKVKELEDEFWKLGYRMRWVPVGSYQIYKDKKPEDKVWLDYIPFVGDQLSMFFEGNKVPFVDIFPMSKKSDGAYHYAGTMAYRNWPNEKLTPAQWDTIGDVPFGHLKLPAPEEKDAREYLDNSYGSNWPEVSYRTFDHRTLKAPIKKEVRLVDFSHPEHSKLK